MISRLFSAAAAFGLAAVCAAPAWADPDDGGPDPDAQPGEYSCALQVALQVFTPVPVGATVTVPVYQSSAAAADPVARSMIVQDPGQSWVQSSQCVPADDPAPVRHDPSEQLFNCVMLFKHEEMVSDGPGPGDQEAVWLYSSVSEVVRAHDEGEAQGEVSDQTAPVPDLQFVDTGCHAIGPAGNAPVQQHGQQPAPAQPAAGYDQVPAEGAGDRQRWACHVDLAYGLLSTSSMQVVEEAGDPGDADPKARDDAPTDGWPIRDSQCVSWSPGS